MRSRPIKSRGFSIIEVLVSCTVVSLLMIVLAQALTQAQNAFHNVSGTADSLDSLRKIARDIRLDLIQTSASQIGVSDSCSSFGCPDGRAIWFLSNIDSNGKPQYTALGEPFWLKTVLYYVAAPQNHVALFGVNCAGGAGPGGLDDRCPHKVLIRKEIDFGTATNLNDDATMESLVDAAQMKPYLLAPTGYKVSKLGQPGLQLAEIVARNLLTFRDLPGMSASITLDLRSVSIARARSKVALGSTSMYNSPFTYDFQLTVFPSVP